MILFLLFINSAFADTNSIQEANIINQEKQTFNSPARNRDDALDNAKKAFLIQSGIQSNIDRAGSYYENVSKKYARAAGIEKELGIILYSAKIIRDRRLQLKFWGEKHIEVARDHVSCSITLPIRFL